MRGNNFPFSLGRKWLIDILHMFRERKRSISMFNLSMAKVGTMELDSVWEKKEEERKSVPVNSNEMNNKTEE